MKSRRLRWVGHAVRMKEVRSAFKILICKPTGKRHLVRPSHRWEDTFRMDLKEIGTAQDRYYWRALVNAALNFWVP